MRKAPTSSPPDVRPIVQSDWVTQTRQYDLITPLFGGGVKPGEPDDITVVRGAEVRGQLRFWWRACRGARFGENLGEMKNAEDLLWGAASTPDKPRESRVQVVVRVINEGRPFQSLDRKGNQVPIGSPSSKYSYAAFPLNDKPGAVVRQGVRFELQISYPGSAASDMEAALWAWETFGGLGARTRRGFGALDCTKISGVENNDIPPADVRGAQGWFRAKLKQHVLEGRWPLDLPHLSRDMRFIVTPANSDPLLVWRFLIDCLKEFRHQRPDAIGEDNRFRPGRNRWPEPDEIRRITRSSTPKHASPVSEVRKFPRAAFGLPIIFEFKRADREAGDPAGKNTLRGQSDDGARTYERLASPLILRPISCAGGGTIGLAAILEGSRLPERVVLSTGDSTRLVSAQFDDADEAEQIMSKDGRTPLLGRQTNVLLSFLDYLGRRAT